MLTAKLRSARKLIVSLAILQSPNVKMDKGQVAEFIESGKLDTNRRRSVIPLHDPAVAAKIAEIQRNGNRLIVPVPGDN